MEGDPSQVVVIKESEKKLIRRDKRANDEDKNIGKHCVHRFRIRSLGLISKQ